MANCPNCNAPLEDDARFCANCGASITPEAQPAAPAAEAPAAETIFCPNCGEQTSAAYEYCEHCGAALNAGGGQKEKKTGGSGMKKWLICGGIVVIAAALIIVLISIFSGGGGKGYGLYIKDGEMYYSRLSKNGVWQVTSKLKDDVDNSYFMYYGEYISRATVMSKDGKTLFFPDKLDNNSSGVTLYYRSTASEKQEAKKVDSDITRYAVNDSASLVTYLKNGNLYQFDVKRGEKSDKMAGDVSTFYVSEDGKKIVYLEDDEGEYLLNVIDSGKDKVKLASGVSLQYVSDDCKTIVYMKDDTLYLNQGAKDKDTKIASDVYGTVRVYDTGEVYYVTEDDNELTLCYFDGKKTSTELIEEFDYWNDYTVSSHDSAAMLVYQDNDDEYQLVVGGGKPKALKAEEPSSFTFSKDGKSIWYVDEPDKNYEGDLYKVTISNGAIKSTDEVDGEVYASYVVYTPGGHLVYFKDVKNSEGELWVDGKKADDDVALSSLQESESGALLYFVDYNFNKGYGTLKQYSGGKAAQIADDVYSFAVLPNGSVLYLLDYSTSRYRGDLYVCSGSRSTQLDEDVVTIIPVTSNKYGYY